MAKIEAQAVGKEFPRGRKGTATFTAVCPTDLAVSGGEIVEVTGHSGSGKSTLLNMMSGMLQPTSGTVLLDGADLYAMSEDELSRTRNSKLGLIPQGHTALLSLTVLENVLFPAILYGEAAPYEERARKLLERVGLSALSDARPNELSGGELRRMAVARALLMEPGVVLADEPTAGLDAENVQIVHELLRETADAGAAVLLVTHEQGAEEFANRVLHMDGGKLV